MKIRMDKALRFWLDVAYHEIKSDHIRISASFILS